jgi:hypothetical protein
VKVKVSEVYTTIPIDTFKQIILDFWKWHSKSKHNDVMSCSEVKISVVTAGKQGIHRTRAGVNQKQAFAPQGKARWKELEGHSVSQ